MNNADGAMRCVQCGSVTEPRVAGRGPAWIAVALWAAVGLVWAVDFILATGWLSFVAAGVLFFAMAYTIWYFSRRERACRHCGGRQFEAPA